jgi:phosphoribosyl 1,2-cyclic phosphate phosphodiesterase
MIKVRILGCGTSSGVPRIGNDWGQCDPANPRNARTRSSILVSHGDYRLIVDTTPDMRTQLLAAHLSTVSAVIWTHDHADHCHGLDDLRQLSQNQRGPVLAYARQSVLDRLHRRFTYAFDGNFGYPPLIDAQPLSDEQRMGPFTVGAVEMPHGPVQASGLRFTVGDKSVGYATDFSEFTDEMAQFFHGVDLFVIDALRRHPHPTHPHVAMALDGLRRCGVSRAVLVHMDNTMDYDDLLDELPDGVEPGFDGQEVWA